MKLHKILCAVICAAAVLSCLAAGVWAADSDFVIEAGVLEKYKGEGGDIVIPEGVTEIGREAFYHSETITSIVIPDGVTKIGYQAFSFSKNLKNVTIPDSVTDIGIAAFSYCTSLTEIRIPPKVTKIEDGAFCGDEALSKVIISEGVTTIGFNAFFACYGIDSIILPESLIHIEDKAFLSCIGLKSITIPANVKTIGDGALLGDNIININVSEENESFKSIDGVLFTKNGKKLLQYPNGIKNDEYTIPNGTTHIGNSAFSGCENLIKVNIPEGVTHIGENAFSDTKFTVISLPATIHSIGREAFDNCLELTEINVPRNSLEYYSIDGVLFEKSTNKLLKYPPKKSEKTYSIPDGITAIERLAFNHCEILDSIEIPDSVVSIGCDAFQWTVYYNYKYEYNGGVLYIGNHLIAVDREINGAYTIKDGTISIADYAFGGKTKLESIIIPDSLKSIGEYAFVGCTSLNSITIPKGIVSIDDYAFRDCTSLREITLPDSLTYIGGYIFANCPDITVHCNEGSYAWQYAVDNGLIPPPVTTTATTAATTPPVVTEPAVTTATEVTVITTKAETAEITEAATETTEILTTAPAEAVVHTSEITPVPDGEVKPDSIISDVLIAVLITGIAVLAGCAVLYVLDRRGIIELQKKNTPDTEESEETEEGSPVPGTEDGEESDDTEE